MGLMDFFKKGKEKPVTTPQPPSRTQTPASTPPPAATNTPKPAAPAPRDYVVQSGDSLSKIARQFYGNTNEWKKIYQANKDRIQDPNLIKPGQKLIIP